MNSVLFVNPNLYRSAEDVLSLVNRFNLYGQVLRENSRKSPLKLILLAGISDKDLESIEDLKFEYIRVIRVSGPSKMPIFFALRSCSIIIREKLNSDILVSSDLYFGFVSTWLISRFLRRKQKIQISIHGSLKRHDESNISKYIRKIYLSFVFKNVNSIRFVSEFLRNEVVKSFSISSKNTFIAPIPVEINMYPKVTIKDNVLAFVGRLHLERGVAEWIGIVSKLYKKRSDFSVKIVGDGELSDDVKIALTHNCEGLHVEFLGRLDHQEVSREWNSIKVLLSSAQTEGYGLAIREAVASSAFVCARASEGATAFSKDYGDVVKTYSSVDEAVEIINNFLDNDFPTGVAEKIRSDLQKSNNHNLEVLVSTWL